MSDILIAKLCGGLAVVVAVGTVLYARAPLSKEELIHLEYIECLETEYIYHNGDSSCDFIIGK